MNRNDVPRQYAVRNSNRCYVVRDPQTALPVPDGTPGLPDGWLEPMLFDEATAEALAARFAAESRDPELRWRVEEAPLPCPSCGRELLADDGDFLYPENREMTKWRAGCNEHDFGCGYEVFGISREEALQKWQAGAPSECTEPDWGMAERRCFIRVTSNSPLCLETPAQLDAAGTPVVMSSVPDEKGAEFELRGPFSSQPALVRRGLKALRAAAGKDFKVEVLDYGARVAGG